MLLCAEFCVEIWVEFCAEFCVVLTQNLIEREAVFCKDLQEKQQLQGIGGCNISKQIILQMNEGKLLVQYIHTENDFGP